MNIRDKKDIRVYNECPFQVNLVGQQKEYIFPPCENDEPTMNFVSFSEIEYAHSRGRLFTIGLLRFDEKDQDEMYDALGIKDWRNKVWFAEDVEDVVLNPTLEKMQRVIDVKDLTTIERVRGKMVSLVNQGRDVSQNVINIINSRYKEINSGNMNSKIVIRSADVEKTVSHDEVDELKAQLAHMQKLMEQMMTANNVKSSDEKTMPAEQTEQVEQPRQVTQKKTGRKTPVKK